MTAVQETPACRSIRIDRLLVYLRFARTRSAAQAMVAAHALRCNRKHVLRAAEQAHIGDVLTIALGENVKVIELIALPDRRGPPIAARSHYREVDVFSEVDVFDQVDGGGLGPKGQIAIAPIPAAAAAARSRSPILKEKQ